MTVNLKNCVILVNEEVVNFSGKPNVTCQMQHVLCDLKIMNTCMKCTLMFTPVVVYLLSEL